MKLIRVKCKDATIVTKIPQNEKSAFSALHRLGLSFDTKPTVHFYFEDGKYKIQVGKQVKIAPLEHIKIFINNALEKKIRFYEIIKKDF